MCIYICHNIVRKEVSVMENFAKRLAQLRKEKGYTQSELADKIGVSNKSVSRWETGVSQS